MEGLSQPEGCRVGNSPARNMPSRLPLPAPLRPPDQPASGARASGLRRDGRPRAACSPMRGASPCSLRLLLTPSHVPRPSWRVSALRSLPSLDVDPLSLVNAGSSGAAWTIPLGPTHALFPARRPSPVLQFRGSLLISNGSQVPGSTPRPLLPSMNDGALDWWIEGPNPCTPSSFHRHCHRSIPAALVPPSWARCASVMPGSQSPPDRLRRSVAPADGDERRRCVYTRPPCDGVSDDKAWNGWFADAGCRRMHHRREADQRSGSWRRGRSVGRGAGRCCGGRSGRCHVRAGCGARHPQSHALEVFGRGESGSREEAQGETVLEPAGCDMVGLALALELCWAI
jgi:hypothetical protein